MLEDVVKNECNDIAAEDKDFQEDEEETEDIELNLNSGKQSQSSKKGRYEAKNTAKMDKKSNDPFDLNMQTDAKNVDEETGQTFHSAENSPKENPKALLDELKLRQIDDIISGLSAFNSANVNLNSANILINILTRDHDRSFNASLVE